MTTTSNLMMNPATAVRLAMRYIDSRDPLSINKAGRIKPFVLGAAITAVGSMLIMSNMEQLEKQHRHHIEDVDVAFEITCAPPEPSYRAMEKLIPINFDEGAKPAAAGVETAKAKQDKQAQDLQNSEEIQRVTAEAVRKAVPEAPVAVSRSAIAGDVPTPTVPQPTISPNNPFLGSAANAASPPSAEASNGATDGQPGGTNNGGTGFGPGKGDSNALAGGDFGIQRGLGMSAAPVAMGNIGPYKRELIARIKETWKPDQPYETVAVEITVDHEGKLVEKSLVQSTGNKHLDDQLLAALDQTAFNALPDWFRGNQLKIKVVLKNT